MNVVTLPQPTARIKWGLARLVIGLDTDLFEDGIPEPWKSVGQRVRQTATKNRQRLLEVEVRGIPGMSWEELTVALAEIDARQEFRVQDSEHQVTALPRAAQFPTYALPDCLGRFVTEGARALHCPPEYIGVPSLAFAGAAIGNTMRLEVKGGWLQQPLLYVCVVGPSGSKKSPASDLASEFTEIRARDFADAYRADIDRYNILQTEYEDALSDYKAYRRKHPGAMSPTQRPTPPVKPVLSRTLVDDSTVEALARVLYENPRGVVLHKDELSGLLQGLNQYKGGCGSDAAFFLSAWSGKSIVVDRKGQAEPCMLPHPFLAIVGGIQPGLLPHVLGGLRLVDGMAARFLFSYPEMMEQRVSDAVVSAECHRSLADLFHTLFRLRPEDDQDGKFEPSLVRMSPDARIEFVQCETLSNERLNALAEDDVRRPPLAKMPSQLARLTLIVHGVRVQCHETPDPEIVDPESVARAAMITDYFASHAERVWQVLREARHDRQARQLLAWIRKQGAAVTKRDIVRNGVAGIGSAAEAEESLRRLEEAEIVRREKTPRSERFTLAPDEALSDA